MSAAFWAPLLLLGLAQGPSYALLMYMQPFVLCRFAALRAYTLLALPPAHRSSPPSPWFVSLQSLWPLFLPPPLPSMDGVGLFIPSIPDMVRRRCGFLPCTALCRSWRWRSQHSSRGQPSDIFHCLCSIEEKTEPAQEIWEELCPPAAAPRYPGDVPFFSWVDVHGFKGSQTLFFSLIPVCTPDFFSLLSPPMAFSRSTILKPIQDPSSLFLFFPNYFHRTPDLSALIVSLLDYACFYIFNSQCFLFCCVNVAEKSKRNVWWEKKYGGYMFVIDVKYKPLYDKYSHTVYTNTICIHFNLRT